MSGSRKDESLVIRRKVSEEFYEELVEKSCEVLDETQKHTRGTYGCNLLGLRALRLSPTLKTSSPSATE